MYAIFEIKDSPAIPFEKVIKVDSVFDDINEKKWGFSVHLGEHNKRCNFYLSSKEEANTVRDQFLKQWDLYFQKKFELID
jgi:uncharacterized protein (UPF0128 family)